MLTLEYKVAGTAAQYAAMDEGIRTVQFIRNTCLRAWMDRQPEGQTAAAMSAYTAVLATAFPFAGRLGSQARQASAERAWAAVSRFYDNCQHQMPGKKGYPRFQHDGRSLEYKATAGWHLEADGQHLTFSDGLGIGRLRLLGTRMKRCDKEKQKPVRSPLAFPLHQIKRVRLIRRADGYFCQFCIDVERQVAHAPTGKQRGIDVGLLAYYTDSDGHTEENPRFFRQAEKKVKRLQRQVSRKSQRAKENKKPKHHHQARKRQQRSKYPKPLPLVAVQAITAPAATPPSLAPQPGTTKPKQPPSHNYHKARSKLARAHLQVQRQREDCARKKASALVSSSDLIAVEDLQIRNLVRNHSLAKSINDAAWGRFLAWVRYYAAMHGIPCIAVPPHYTSQDCSGTLPDGSRCPARVPKSLSMRTHICPRCGLVLDRDHNSARDILLAGLAICSRTLGHRGTG